MIDIKKYIKERGFDANYILVNNYGSRITIGNLLEGFDNLAEDDVSNQRKLLIAYQEYLNESNETYLHGYEYEIDKYLKCNLSTVIK